VAKQALVPLNIAEFLRVTLALAKQSHLIDSDTKSHIGIVLAMYETGRDEYLLNNGYTQKQIDGIAHSAALALANHFEDQANTAIEGAQFTDVLDRPASEFCMDDFEAQFSDSTEDPD
jgi:hypothetical protein